MARALIADDEDAILRALSRAFEGHLDVVAVRDGDDAWRQLDEGEFDVVIMDQRMPGHTGTEILKRSRELYPASRRVLITASDDPRDIEGAVNDAAIHAFFVKPLRLMELRNGVMRLLDGQRLEAENASLVTQLEDKNVALEAALERVREHERFLEDQVGLRTAELEQANADLERLARHDALTGLLNRRAFEEVYVRELARAERYGAPLGVLFIDVDNFKSFNDTHGHPEGDKLIKAVASLLVPGNGNGGRATDIAARYGGEEFVVLLPETDKKGAVIRAERLRHRVEQSPFKGRETQPLGIVSISVGVAAFPEDAADDTELLVKADKALLRAKTEGRNRVNAWAIEGGALQAYGITARETPQA